MNNKFDELTKQMAQSVTRRAALKRFGVGLAGMALACLGVKDAGAAPPPKGPGYCEVSVTLLPGSKPSYAYTGRCFDLSRCQYGTSSDCKGGGIKDGDLRVNPCGGGGISTIKTCSF